MLLKTAQAGTLESSDCLVVVSPADSHSLEYSGQNAAIFKRRTERIVAEIAKRCAPQGAAVQVQDRGALEATLRARVETAFERASKQEQQMSMRGGQ
ncbi:MAG: citrate lyase acyl carrier protein [Synergistaceae bacterium]|jgi:citrate lyase subunit gamma (acyl carrier protein)|nr:citrate lyase acyl carrier protein [Synergistaceae bacterium]